MGTDWKLIDNFGNEYKSWAAAIRALTRDRRLTFVESTLSMAGTQERDVTAEVERAVERRYSDDPAVRSEARQELLNRGFSRSEDDMDTNAEPA